jgi:hypothetical protein
VTASGSVCAPGTATADLTSGEVTDVTATIHC